MIARHLNALLIATSALASNVSAQALTQRTVSLSAFSVYTLGAMLSKVLAIDVLPLQTTVAFAR